MRRFLSLLDALFPNVEFLVRLPALWQELVPAALLANTLPAPQPLPPPRRAAPARLPRGTVLLVDVDSQLPNLALMKLSRHFRNQGQRVALERPAARMPRAQAVFASCVFAFPQSARRVEWLRQVTARDNVEFVCLYGFDTTLAEDVERFAFLRTLPGAYVFVQRYRPPLGGPAPDLSRFFDDRAEERIHALLQINFTQNMKSLEVYYRWLCLLYARMRGRIHQRLVETLFRYNRRHLQGSFLMKLNALCAAPRADGGAARRPPRA